MSPFKSPCSNSLGCTLVKFFHKFWSQAFFHLASAAWGCQPTLIKYSVKTSLRAPLLSCTNWRWEGAATVSTDLPGEGEKEVTRNISGFHGNLFQVIIIKTNLCSVHLCSRHYSKYLKCINFFDNINNCMKSCYRLHVCVSLNSYVETLTLNGMVLGGGPFGWWLCCEGEARLMGLVLL